MKWKGSHTQRDIKISLAKGISSSREENRRDHEDVLIFSSCLMGWHESEIRKKRWKKSSSFKRHLLFWVRWIKFQWSLKLILIQSIKTIWQWCVYSGVGKLIIWENIFWSLSFPLILTLAHTQTKLYWTVVMLSMETNNNTSFPCVTPIFRFTWFPRCEGHLGFSLDTRGASLSALQSQQQFPAMWSFFENLFFTPFLTSNVEFLFTCISI